MLYVKPHGCAGADRDPATLPRKSLKSFKRVSLQPQQATSVTLSLTAADLQLHGMTGMRLAGCHSIVPLLLDCVFVALPHRGWLSRPPDFPLRLGADAHATCKWTAEVGGQTIGLQSEETAVY